MGRSSVQYAFTSEPDGDRFWFAGTTAFSKGAAFCFVEDATIESTRGEPTQAENRTRLGAVIEKPATASLKLFAGWAKEGGTGPCVVNLMRPQKGAIVDVQVDGGTTNVAIGDNLVITDATHYLTVPTAPTNTALMLTSFDTVVAVAMEAETDDAANQASGQTRRVKVR
jgi:hypothetical protein